MSDDASPGRLSEVRLGAASPERFAQLLPDDIMQAVRQEAEALAAHLDGRSVWNINSTAVGGGVAEMLRPLLALARGAGVDARWLVIRGEPAFFRLTKRLHHALHGSAGDGLELGEDAHRLYQRVLRENAVELESRVQAGDVVVLHDPQTAGLAGAVRDLGATPIWRCHIGHDSTSNEVERAWDFLSRYLQELPAYVFSRRAYVPAFCDPARTVVIQPSIDAFSPKNQELEEGAVRAILAETGLVEGPPPADARPRFAREDGSPGRVERGADVLRLGRATPWDTPLVIQVSRWDPLKDPLGVMQGFARLLESSPAPAAELVLAGPNVNAVADDPEAPQVFEETAAAWRALPHSIRRRVHLAMLPTTDVEENAAIVNALQRHAAVVVQKSLHEGFGLTVTEAMWKGRPVVASAVGGIQDQIEDGVHGLLLRDPQNLDAFAEALGRLLADPALGAKLGGAARERALTQFNGLRHLRDYGRLIQSLVRGEAPNGVHVDEA